MPYNKKFESTIYDQRWLFDNYITKRRSAAQIAAEVGCERTAVLSRLRRFGIPVRDLSQTQLARTDKRRGSSAPRPRAIFRDTLHNPKWMRKRAHLNASELAREAGCSVPSAQQAMRKAGLPVPGISEALAGRSAVSRRKPVGETVSRATSSRRAGALCPMGQCAVCGRASEHVNHIDRDWQNNAPENLEPLCAPCHRTQHACEARTAFDMLKERGVSYREIWDRARAQILAGDFRVGKRSISRVTIGGQAKSVGEWAEGAGVREATFRKRLNAGWDPAEALRTPSKRPPRVEFQGVTDTVLGHARRMGLDPGNVYSRLRYGWTLERALLTPIRS